MPVTKEQALTEDRFHFSPSCTEQKTERWRRNGQTKTWKTRPDEFKVPVKYGLRDYYSITHENAEEFHTEKECPHNHT